MILVRHAESEWNLHYGRTRIDPGIADPPLTRTGLAQAERLVGELAAEGISRLVSSPYRRALETASIIARGLDVPLSVEPLVRERCAFSCDVGTASSLLCDRWPGLDFAHLDEQWWGEGEESVAGLEQRCAAFHAKTVNLHGREQTAVITHWGFIRMLTGRELGNARFVRLEAARSAPIAHPIP